MRSGNSGERFYDFIKKQINVLENIKKHVFVDFFRFALRQVSHKKDVKC